MTEPVLSVRNLRVEFVTRHSVLRAIDGISFDIAKGEVLGGRLGFLYGTAADHTASLRLIANTIRYGRWSGVLRLVAKDGTVRLHKRTILPLKDERGRIAGIFGVSRPLTRPIPGLPAG